MRLHHFLLFSLVVPAKVLGADAAPTSLISSGLVPRSLLRKDV